MSLRIPVVKHIRKYPDIFRKSSHIMRKTGYMRKFNGRIHSFITMAPVCARSLLSRMKLSLVLLNGLHYQKDETFENYLFQQFMGISAGIVYRHRSSFSGPVIHQTDSDGTTLQKGSPHDNLLGRYPCRNHIFHLHAFPVCFFTPERHLYSGFAG